jgi:hypothetical protein
LAEAEHVPSLRLGGRRGGLDGALALALPLPPSQGVILLIVVALAGAGVREPPEERSRPTLPSHHEPLVAAGARGAPGSWARGEGWERGRRWGGREAADEAGGGGGRGGGGGGGGERHRGGGAPRRAEPSRAVATWRAVFEVETDWAGGGKNPERGGLGGAADQGGRRLAASFPITKGPHTHTHAEREIVTDE